MTGSFISNRNIGNTFFEDTTSTTLLGLPSGKFSAYYRQGLRTVHEDVFDDAKLELQRTLIPFQYVLVVTCIKLSEPNKNHSYECMYETKYNTSREEATEQDILQFLPLPTILQTASHGLSKHASVKDSKPEIDPKPMALSMSSLSIQDSRLPIEKFIIPTGSVLPFSSQETLVSVQADLFIFRPDDEKYRCIGHGLEIALETEDIFSCWISIVGKQTFPIAQPIEPNMNPHFNKEEKSFYWNYYEGENVYSLLVKIFEEDEYEEFIAAFGQSMYEASRQMFFSKLCKGDQDYISDAYENGTHSLNNFQESDDDDTDILEDETNDEQDEYENPDLKEFLKGSCKNTLLAVSGIHKRSYVVRGSRIGIYQTLESGKILFDSYIKSISASDNREFTPSYTILHKNETSLLMLTPHDNSRVFRMDIERGKIVESWKLNPQDTVMGIAPSFKDSQMSAEQSIVGITPNTVFKIDPRQQGVSKIKESEYKKHLKQTDFSAVATTATGKVTVGSKKGEIRLFDALGKTAKNILPPMRDPILYIDVTSQGRYIVATCSTYLIVIDTLHKNDPKQRLGFEVSFGSRDKPIPWILRIRPEHTVRMKDPINFTFAKFDTGPGDEKWIVSSTGSFSVMWSLKAVCAGRVDSYKLQKFDSPVVDTCFDQGRRQDIVLAYKDDIRLLSRHKLVPATTSLFLSTGISTRHYSNPENDT
ncbi:VID27 cytoplasmic protein-domain-containing protein [Phycomyces nitens]|nr:VID27 cytoplasmic protein-domain-containing protein [Phycomyces nitens]